MPECLALKHAAAIGPLGTVRPCCAWDNNQGKETPLGEDFSDKHREWHAEMKTQWLPECQECQQAEQRDGTSLRTYFNEILADSQGIEYWDFKINNTCNLACRMCDPVNSSTWVAVQKQIDTNYRYTHTGKWHRDTNEILPELFTAKVVKFTGGEPFLIPQVKTIIDFLVEQEIAPAVRLEFITNGTQDLTKYYNLFKMFLSVDILVSIDAIGDRFEYIRQGASWKQVSDNVINIKNNKLSNMGLTVTCLPQALNALHYPEVEVWCRDNGINFSLASDCIEPDYMRPEAIIDPVLNEKLIRKLEILDMIHGTDYRDFI